MSIPVDASIPTNPRLVVLALLPSIALTAAILGCAATLHCMTMTLQEQAANMEKDFEESEHVVLNTVESFDRKKWNRSPSSTDEYSQPPGLLRTRQHFDKSAMCRDLIRRGRLIGLTAKDIRETLGRADSETDADSHRQSILFVDPATMMYQVGTKTMCSHGSLGIEKQLWLRFSHGKVYSARLVIPNCGNQGTAYQDVCFQKPGLDDVLFLYSN